MKATNQNRVWWRVVMNTMVDFRVTLKAGNFLITRATLSFSRTFLSGVSGACLAGFPGVAQDVSGGKLGSQLLSICNCRLSMHTCTQKRKLTYCKHVHISVFWTWWEECLRGWPAVYVSRLLTTALVIQNLKQQSRLTLTYCWAVAFPPHKM
jgi:hypothetical protein